MIEIGLLDIKKTSALGWFNQFCNDEERFFASCVMDQVIFRTRQQFESGIRSLIRGNLNGHFSGMQDDLSLLHLLTSKTDPLVRIVPVICEKDPPTKSGPLVVRRLQRILKINNKWICWPWQIPKLIKDKKVNKVIFIDDFLGAGKQFCRFLEQWDLKEQTSGNVDYFYAPVVAHQRGLDHLAIESANTKVSYAELLNDNHNFFSKNNWQKLSNNRISHEEAKKWYQNFCAEKEIIPRTIGCLGFGEMGLTFGFSHSTPNNSLSILWCESPKWQPLLER